MSYDHIQETGVTKWDKIEIPRVAVFKNLTTHLQSHSAYLLQTLTILFLITN